MLLLNIHRSIQMLNHYLHTQLFVELITGERIHICKLLDEMILYRQLQRHNMLHKILEILLDLHKQTSLCKFLQYQSLPTFIIFLFFDSK